MNIVPHGNYSYPRIGHEIDITAGLPGPWGFTAGAEFVATRSDQERWGLVPGRAYRTWTLHDYPFVIDADIEFNGVNFEQVEPHTEIFAVVLKPDSLVRPIITFVECRLINVRVPDGAVIIGGNLLHGFDAPTGNPKRPTVKTLCACEKCCVVRPIIQEVLEFGGRNAMRDEQGRWLHSDLKAHYAERRKDLELMSAHQEQILMENDEAVAWWDPRQDGVR